MTQEKGVTLIAYANDVAIVVNAKTKVMLEELMQISVKRVINTLEDKKIKIAIKKTELILCLQAVKNWEGLRLR